MVQTCFHGESHFSGRKKNTVKIHLLVIDPQNDFCDPSVPLYVKGADQDMKRLAEMTKRLAGKIDDIHVTLDSHHKFDIAHPTYWVDSSGKNPAPFTIISVNDVKGGKWQPAIPGLHKRSLDYVEKLKANGKYDLCIWPEHCLIGSWGHGVNPEFLGALNHWCESKPGRIVDFVTKGSNPFSEHYSAIQAEVPDVADPSTQLNSALIKCLIDVDRILIAGEALSHCVANTVTDVANAFGDDSLIGKLTLLTDASSSVGGFEKNGNDFVTAMVARGMKLSTTVDFLA